MVNAATGNVRDADTSCSCLRFGSKPRVLSGDAHTNAHTKAAEVTDVSPQHSEMDGTWSEQRTGLALQLPPPAPMLLRRAAGPVQVLRGGRAQAPQLPEGLAHGAGVVGQTLDVLEGHVDDLVAAGAAVQVAARQALEAGLVGDAALAVWQVGAQGQGAGQGAAVQAAGLAGALLSGRP